MNTNYNSLPTADVIKEAVTALKAKNYDVAVATSKDEALLKIKEIIPSGASVMNGTSVTLEQIGFVDYLKAGTHGWNNLHEVILNEKDPAKQTVLRKQSILSEYYLGSLHALTETGEFIVASNTGSQLSEIAFSSQNLIIVSSTKKIVKDLGEALKRLSEYVVPLEDKHMLEKYKMNTAVNKILIFNNENPMMGRKVHFILINEDLGF